MNVGTKMVDINGDDKGKLLVILIFLVDFENDITEGLFSRADKFVNHPEITIDIAVQVENRIFF